MDEEAELAELRALIGDADLERLRPTSAAATSSMLSQFSSPPPRAPTTGRREQRQKHQHQHQQQPQHQYMQPRFPESSWTADRSARKGSARSPASPPGHFISRRAAIAEYHARLAGHAKMLEEEKMLVTGGMCKAMFIAGDHALVMQDEFASTARGSASETQSPVHGSSFAPLTSQELTSHNGNSIQSRRGGSVDAQRAADFGGRGGNAGKGEMHDEEYVGRDTAPAHRGPGRAQTSRGHEGLGVPSARYKHVRSSGYGQTSRSAKPRPFVGPGWDSSPARSVPYALRGSKPITNEPWAVDDAINRKGGLEKRGGLDTPPDGGSTVAKATPPASGRPSAFRSAKKRVSPMRPAWDGSKTLASRDAQPAWDSTKTTAWDLR